MRFFPSVGLLSNALTLIPKPFGIWLRSYSSRAHFKIHTVKLLFIVNVYNKISFNKNAKRTVHRRNVILGECQVEQTYVT